MVTESSQRHRELLQNMHDVSADSIVCSGITVREHHQAGALGHGGNGFTSPRSSHRQSKGSNRACCVRMVENDLLR